MLCSFPNIERLDHPLLMPCSLQIDLQSSLAASEISDLLAPVLLLLQLLDDYVQGVLRPLVDLLPVPLVVVGEQFWVLLKQGHGLRGWRRVQLLVQVPEFALLELVLGGVCPTTTLGGGSLALSLEVSLPLHLYIIIE